MGDDRETVEGLKLRSIDMTVMGCAFIGWYAPEYGMTEAPFVWRDYQHIDRVWRGEIGEELRQTLRERAGLEMLHLWYRGPRYLTTTSKKIHSPEDLRGLKLRVPELEVYIKSWQTFGANTTPLPFTDMFMALKLGVVEGQENPLATIYGNNLHEVQKYIMETHHLIGFYVFCTGPHFDERFTEQRTRDHPRGCRVRHGLAQPRSGTCGGGVPKNADRGRCRVCSSRPRGFPHAGQGEDTGTIWEDVEARPLPTHPGDTLIAHRAADSRLPFR